MSAEIMPRADAEWHLLLENQKAEADALREQVAHLRAQNESYALDIKMLHEQANSASVMLRMAREQREAEAEDAADTIATLTAERDRLRKLFTDVGGDEHNALALVDLWQSEVMTARADVERLTKEREQLIHVDVLNSAHDREITHLAAIETLLPILERVDEAQSLNYEDANRCIYKCGGYDLVKAAKAATADYAKKADEVTDV